MMSPSESIDVRLRAGAVIEPEGVYEEHIIGRMWEDGKLILVFHQNEFIGHRLKPENSALPHKVHLL